jgi:uncharacterized membrane protein YwzB
MTPTFIFFAWALTGIRIREMVNRPTSIAIKVFFFIVTLLPHIG